MNPRLDPDFATLLNFLIPAESDEELARFKAMDRDRDWRAFVAGPFNWSLQTYLALRNRGLPLTCSRNLLRDRINIGHAAHVSTLRPVHSFLVSLQADYRPCGWANVHVVQNKKQVRKHTQFWMPHWPQPGLIERSSTRRGVSTVAFAGLSYNLAGNVADWSRELREIGCEFRLLGPSNWNDFSEVDVVIGIRNFDRRNHDTKPPTKLFSAWLAGAVAILGNDSAYGQVGVAGEDYLVANTLQDAVALIKRLRDDPPLFDQIVQHGKRKAQCFTSARITNRWIDLLAGPVQMTYHEWQHRGPSRAVVWCARVAADSTFRAARKLARRVRRAATAIPLLKK
jgi:hypothetical protein